MKVLIIGEGGREHALAWKAAQARSVEKVFVAPGNAGTAGEKNVSNIALAATDIEGLLKFAQEESIDLTIVGPEAPLVAGIVDRFEAVGLNCFGPSQKASQLEGSKAFTKDFLARHQIPTAAYGNFSDANEAENFIRKMGAPIVIKADGLAAGKGVVIAQTVDEAITVAREMLAGSSFGDAGKRVVIEEFLTGEEASFIVIVDGTTVLPLATSQDHKARLDGDQGPNTGGMGAYSPAPVVTPEVYERIMTSVIRPTVEGMAEEGAPFRGFLYAGVMINDQGIPYVLEFNCRMGDPETQPIMQRLNSDITELCLAACQGRLDHVSTQWDERISLGVVMVSGGYPDTYAKGFAIEGLDQPDIDDVKVFHAGTRQDEQGNVVNSGGRVLCVCALGSTTAEAQQKAYHRARQIHWQDCAYRTDIGYRAIARENNR